MPRRKDESGNSETLRIRISPALKGLCNEARLAGAHRRMAESSFIGYLIEIGLEKYRNAILPLEQGQEPEGPENP
ncbi:MAG: hypothetical protein LBQ38_08595 [Spirochaetaceae bacterium]|jgi:hypothetical protein|nr:hypothetical protein [Spirochaetaceae bacterium]